MINCKNCRYWGLGLDGEYKEGLGPYNVCGSILGNTRDVQGSALVFSEYMEFGLPVFATTEDFGCVEFVEKRNETYDTNTE